MKRLIFLIIIIAIIIVTSINALAVAYKECDFTQSASIMGITTTVSFSYLSDSNGNCCTQQTGAATRTTSVSNGFYTNTSTEYTTVSQVQGIFCETSSKQS